MKDSIKIGFGIYLGVTIAQIIDKGFGLSDRAIELFKKIKITEEVK